MFFGDLFHDVYFQPVGFSPSMSLPLLVAGLMHASVSLYCCPVVVYVIIARHVYVLCVVWLYFPVCLCLYCSFYLDVIRMRSVLTD